VKKVEGVRDLEGLPSCDAWAARLEVLHNGDNNRDCEVKLQVICAFISYDCCLASPNGLDPEQRRGEVAIVIEIWGCNYGVGHNSKNQWEHGRVPHMLFKRNQKAQDRRANRLVDSVHER
jgi:hypothetical protein